MTERDIPVTLLTTKRQIYLDTSKEPFVRGLRLVGGSGRSNYSPKGVEDGDAAVALLTAKGEGITIDTSKEPFVRNLRLELVRG